MKRLFIVFFFCIAVPAAVFAVGEKGRKLTIGEARQMAWIFDSIPGPYRGVMVSFHGLNNTKLRAAPSSEERMLAKKGYLIIHPYCGPWHWMNRQAREMVDEIVDAVYEEYGIPDSVPLVTMGGSMGGFCAILYTRYARRPVSACVANCPVTDIKYHFTERPDLPRTFRCAYWGYDNTFEESMTEHNPMDQVREIPDIHFFIMQTSGDRSVSKAHHSDRFVKAMRKSGHRNVVYKEIEGGKHCGPIPAEIQKEKRDFLLRVLEE